MRRVLAVGFVLLLATSIPGHAARPDAPARLIVGFDHTAGAADADLLAEHGATILRVVPNADFIVVSAARAAAFQQDARDLPGVRYVEVDGIITEESTPNDRLWNKQWGPQAINADEAWDITFGSDQVIYGVVDTGVDYTHPDLLQAMWMNPGENPVDGVDNDGNGYVDDIFGWDCAAGDNDPQNTNNGHGSHVAGIAAARTNNVWGIAGIAQVKVMALKIFEGGSFNSAAAECIRYAADNGARVAGMSWYTSPSTAINDAIAYAWGKNVVLVKSAGNQNGGQVTYPGTLPEVIAVSALSNPTTLASYSSVGAKVELAAPGSSILAPYPMQGNLNPTNMGNAILSGTSMAQPHAAGVACLILSKNPALTNQQVRDILAQSADDLGAPGRDPQFGHGRINALAAVNAAGP